MFPQLSLPRDVTARGTQAPAAQGGAEPLRPAAVAAEVSLSQRPQQNWVPAVPTHQAGWERGVLGTCPGTRVQGELVLMRRTWLLVRRGAGGEPRS